LNHFTVPVATSFLPWTQERHRMVTGIRRKKGPASVNRPITIFSRSRELDHNVSLWPVGECRLRRAQAMTKPPQRLPRWLTIDLMILAVGAAIMIVAAVILSADFP
jgi:hypothetical protein